MKYKLTEANILVGPAHNLLRADEISISNWKTKREILIKRKDVIGKILLTAQSKKEY